VIGIGNPLRGDDGVGALLAERGAPAAAACPCTGVER
jgi:Ni,Fe-hydrogenase maturation factor